MKPGIRPRGGPFIPVSEIGSPFNLWNFPSNVNTALSTGRTGHFTGVVLAGGTHADSIQGGGELINAVMDVLVGVSLPQNEQALVDLAAVWLSELVWRDFYHQLKNEEAHHNYRREQPSLFKKLFNPEIIFL